MSCLTIGSIDLGESVQLPLMTSLQKEKYILKNRIVSSEKYWFLFDEANVVTRILTLAKFIRHAPRNTLGGIRRNLKMRLVFKYILN